MISKIKEYLKNNKTSYVLYIVSIIFLVSSIVLFYINQEYFKLYKNITIGYIVIPLFLIAFLFDVWRIIKGLWKRTIGKIIYSILGYFAFTYAHSLAKNSIYYVTHENPDFYQTSIEFLSAIYLIPSWIIFLNSFIAFFILAIMTIATPFMFFKLDKVINTLNKLFELLKTKIVIQKRDIFHLIFTVFASMIFLAKSMSIIPYLNEVFNDIFISKAILIYSYYPNKVCKNIPKNQYIKLIGVDKVSKSNVSNVNYIMINYNVNNKKITYETLDCIR